MTLTLTLELTNSAHAALLAAADVQGKEPEQLIAAHLEKCYENCDAEVYYKVAEALQDDGSRDVSLEEYIKQREAERTLRSSAAPTPKVLVAA